MPKKTIWNVSDCWVASFDILGFKNLINIEGGTFKAECIQADYEETLSFLQSSCDGYRPGDIDYCWLSDTFVLFSCDASARAYTIIQQAAKRFIERCIYSRVPIRGAISVGCLIRSHDNRSLMGRAFVSAYVYGEDQDWLGLLLTPEAIIKARSYGLEPTHHDFIASPDIPMRDCIVSEVLAYRFQNGSANYSSPFLPALGDMMHQAESKYHPKYQRTMDFIKKYYHQHVVS